MRPSICEHYLHYFPEELPYVPFPAKPTLKDGFICQIRLSALPQKDTILLTLPGVLEVRAGVYHFPADLSKLDPYAKGDCYTVYTDQEGNCPYLEAGLRLLDAPGGGEKAMRLGLPLRLLERVDTPLFLLYDGVRFAWLANGEIVNTDFPFGHLDEPRMESRIDDTTEISLCLTPKDMRSQEKTELLQRSAAFYSARGFNAWAGDIVNFYADGTYHFLVLLDRHHHRNRFGGGAHSTFHMTTKDFVHWENYGEITPISQTWESFGTGTMLFFKGKYYYTHGLHTSRMISEEKTGTQLMKKRFEEQGVFHAISYEELAENGLTPCGTNYLVSEDGIHFIPGRKQIHPAENPSIYADGEELVMYAGYGFDGVWRAPDIDGPWRRVETSMPIAPKSSAVYNSTECPSIFHWDGYTYILMGFRGYWQSGYDNQEFTDMAVIGDDIYDGLCVPMVASVEDRRILAGWVNGLGWAFVTQHRELIQKESGRLGLRWMPELTPDETTLPCRFKQKRTAAGQRIALSPKQSYYLIFRVHPGKAAKVGLGLAGDIGGCVFALNTPDKKVQIKATDTPERFTAPVKALYEHLPDMPADRSGWPPPFPDPDLHFNSCDFAIAHVEELQQDYTCRIMLHYEPKNGNLVLDAEIGGGRTFISNRPDFCADSLTILAEDADILDFSIYEL